MANIQAALNSMLSSAASGAFLYSQTPEFKRQAELKILKQQLGAQEAESELLVDIFEDETAPNQAHLSAAERSDELSAEQYETHKRLYQLTGDPSHFKESLKYTPSQRDLATEMREQQELAVKEKQAILKKEKLEKKAAAEQEALRKQEEEIEKQRTQKAALEARKRILEGTVPADRFNELMKEVR